jgi:tetratricopeptide (TPR) repeat protein
MAKKRRKKKAPVRRSSRATAAYRSEEYVMFIAHAEIGICEAWAMQPALTDGDVETSLHWLIKELERSPDLPELESFNDGVDDDGTLHLDKVSRRDLIAFRILEQWYRTAMEHGARSNRDLAGCLRVILESMDAWTRGPASRGYLAYVRDFVTNQLGVKIEMVSESGERLSPLDEVPRLDEGRGVDLDVDPLSKVGDYLLENPQDEEAQQAFVYRVMALISRRETEGLLDLCQKLLNKARNKELRAVLLLALGQLQRHEVNPERSIHTLRRAVTADPGYLAGWIALGDAYRANEQFRDAIHAYQTALDMAPDHLPTYERLALACRAAGDHKTAVTVLRRQVSQFPQLLAPRYDLAQALRQYGEAEPEAKIVPDGWLKKLFSRPQSPAAAAEREMERARTASPNSRWQFADWTVYVRLRLEEDAPDEALFQLQKAREQEIADSNEMMLLTAVTLEAAGRTKEATAIWHNILPASSRLIYLYALVRERLGHLLPDDSPLFAELADRPAGEQPDLALAPPETAESAAGPPQPTPDLMAEADDLLERAFAALEKQNIKAAGRLFQQAHDLLPGDASLFGLGLVHMFSDRYDEGYAAFDKAVTMVDDDPDYWFNLGMAAIMVDRSGRALQALERSLKLGGLDRETGQIARENMKLLRQDVRANQREWGMSRSLDDYVHLEDLFHRGVSAMANNELTVAVELFRECVAFNDRHHQSWGNLGVCLIERGDYDEAEAALMQALTIDPDYEIARDNLEKLAWKRQNNGTTETEIAIVNRPPRPGR